jgi:hypothetical protein
MTDHREAPPISFVADVQCQIDIYGERKEMNWHRLQKRYADVIPPKIKINGHNFRERARWETFKRHLIKVAASVNLPKAAEHNLEVGRKLGREKKAARGK